MPDRHQTDLFLQVIPKICAQVVCLASLAAAALFPITAQAWRSTLYPTNWQPPTVSSVNFETDKVIQDFSYAGYRAGEQPLPVVTGPLFNATQSPFNADNTGAIDATTAIQAAINTAQSAGGGVVFLPAGQYSVSPQGANSYALQINAGNVVLRGAGTNATFLLNTSTNMRNKSIILVTGPSAAGFYSSGAGSTAISQDLSGPTTSIPVLNTNGFATGQWVVVRADCTDAWVTEHNEPDWLGYSNQLRGVAYFRRVTSVTAGSITINAPTRYYLKTRDNTRVVRLSAAPLLHCGLEDFSIGNRQHHGPGWAEDDYNVAGTGAYDVHDAFAIRMLRVRDSWVRNVATFQPAGNPATCHLLSNGILLNDSSQITLTNCHFQRSQYGGAGGNGYMYRLQNVSDCLLDNCQSTFTRHGFVISHMGTAGNVFHECVDKDSGRQTGIVGSQGTAGANSDHHMHFSHANLVDACTGDGSVWEARYRPYGSAPLHNLTAAHSIFWNTRGTGSGPGYVVQTEQSRYGYAIGTRGARTGISLSTYGGTTCAPADHVEGIGTGDTLEPFSLYQDQLNRRLSLPQVTLPASIILGFPTNSLRLQPSVHIGSQEASTNQFTATWRVISATGQVLLSNSNAPNPQVTFGGRGTNELEVTVTANGQQTSARILILLAFSDATTSEKLVATADTFVRDGSFGNDNYGTDTTLLLKKNSVAGYSRRAFLRFDFTSLTLTNFDRAFLELRCPTPPAVNPPTLALHFVTNDLWLETSTTWNNQPVLGATLASWLMATNGVDRIEITAPIRNEISNDNVLSLCLLVSDPFSDAVYSFHAREAAPELRPQLILEKTNHSSFAGWIAGFPGLPPNEITPEANPDGDRLTNAEEFFFLRNPTVIDSAPGFDVLPAASGLLLNFTQRKNLPAGCYYLIESTPSLFPAHWQPAPGIEFNNVADLGDAFSLSALIPAGGMLQSFYRFRLVVP